MIRKWCVALLISVFALSSLAPIASAVSVAPGQPDARSSIAIQSILPSLTSPQPVGTSITWTVSATGPGPLEYQFSVRRGTSSSIVQDYGAPNSFTYVDIQQEAYTVVVAVQLASAPGSAVSRNSTAFSVSSKVTGGKAVVTATSNPLVALFSGPSCPAGSTVAINFFPEGKPTAITTTPSQPCNGRSVNVYIAGMRASNSYGMQQVVTTGSTVLKSAPIAFTTGALTQTFPAYTIPTPSNSNTSRADSVMFLDTADTKFPFAAATDLQGHVIWYYSESQYSNFGPADMYVNHPVQGGTVLALLGDSMTSTMTLREIDLAGNTVRQTTVGRINEQLAARGVLQIDSLSHEVVRFPNGHTLTDGYIEKMYPAGTQGSTGPVDILSDEIVDLDQNFQVDWTWSAFDWLDINRKAILGETCTTGEAGCPIPGPVLAPIANDWTHGNAIALSPNDNDILFSMRHQDWIIKIDYNNATGTGAVIWKLGLGGDFTIDDPSNNPYPWFSHQHGIENDVGTSLDQLVTFDDGNTRCAGAQQPCDSRGQVYQLDEVNKIATLSLNADTKGYSPALGWAQTLANGNFSFTSGYQTGTSGIFGQAIEIQPTSEAGTVNYVFQQPDLLYRAYRMTSLYGY